MFTLETLLEFIRNFRALIGEAALALFECSLVARFNGTRAELQYSFIVDVFLDFLLNSLHVLLFFQKHERRMETRLHVGRRREYLG
jgi:hypothetical protein